MQNKEQYFENLFNIKSFIEDLHTTNFMVIGDWNANLREGGNSLFGPTMLEFCNDNNLIISSKLNLLRTLTLMSAIEKFTHTKHG